MQGGSITPHKSISKPVRICHRHTHVNTDFLCGPTLALDILARSPRSRRSWRSWVQPPSASCHCPRSARGRRPSPPAGATRARPTASASARRCAFGCRCGRPHTRLQAPAREHGVIIPRPQQVQLLKQLQDGLQLQNGMKCRPLNGIFGKQSAPRLLGIYRTQLAFGEWISWIPLPSV